MVRILHYVGSVHDDNAVWDFGRYQEKKRSQQLDAHGILSNRNLLERLAELGTGLRFRNAQMEAAINESMKLTRKLNTTKFSNKHFAKACSNTIAIILCHARMLPQNLERALRQLTGDAFSVGKAQELEMLSTALGGTRRIDAAAPEIH